MTVQEERAYRMTVEMAEGSPSYCRPLTDTTDGPMESPYNTTSFPYYTVLAPTDRPQPLSYWSYADGSFTSPDVSDARHLDERYQTAFLAPSQRTDHAANLHEQAFEQWMRYYGSLRKVDLSVTNTYTADMAWAHTDCTHQINARPIRPAHTLAHEIEHCLAELFGYSQNEYWIDFRARDPGRDGTRSRSVVVRGDIY